MVLLIEHSLYGKNICCPWWNEVVPGMCVLLPAYMTVCVLLVHSPGRQCLVVHICYTPTSWSASYVSCMCLGYNPLDFSWIKPISPGPASRVSSMQTWTSPDNKPLVRGRSQRRKRLNQLSRSSTRRCVKWRLKSSSSCRTRREWEETARTHTPPPPSCEGHGHSFH